MATTQRRKGDSRKMLLIWDGPGIVDLMFSEYSPGEQYLEFTVEGTDGVRGERRRGGVVFSVVEPAHGARGFRVTGSDRVEREMRDALGQYIPSSARLVRLFGWGGLWEGWYNPGSPRRGFLQQANES